MPKQFTRIDSSEIKEGTVFSAPVFFDDGENMFLAEGKPAKKYHVDAIKRWDIDFLLTYGRQIKTGESVIGSDNDEDLDELEELEEL